LRIKRPFDTEIKFLFYGSEPAMFFEQGGLKWSTQRKLFGRKEGPWQHGNAGMLRL